LQQLRVYAEKAPPPGRQRALSARKPDDVPAVTRNVVSDHVPEPTGVLLSANGLSSEPVDPVPPWIPFSTEQPELPENVIPDDGFFLDDSLFTFGDSLTPNLGPMEWYVQPDPRDITN
jgi:hypothetical protein